jgi:hypothetical protein
VQLQPGSVEKAGDPAEPGRGAGDPPAILVAGEVAGDSADAFGRERTQALGVQVLGDDGRAAIGEMAGLGAADSRCRAADHNEPRKLAHLNSCCDDDAGAEASILLRCHARMAASRIATGRSDRRLRQADIVARIRRRKLYEEVVASKR